MIHLRCAFWLWVDEIGHADQSRFGAERGSAEWLVGDRITQADVTLGCAVTYASETVGLAADEAALPALRARHARLGELPAFREIYLRFDAPVIG